MIHHIVQWTLKDPADAPRFKALLDGCAGLVPGMLAFEVGIRSTRPWPCSSARCGASATCWTSSAEGRAGMRALRSGARR